MCWRGKFRLAKAGKDKEVVNIGLLTNQTGIDSQGRRTIDVLKPCRE